MFRRLLRCAARRWSVWHGAKQMPTGTLHALHYGCKQRGQFQFLLWKGLLKRPIIRDGSSCPYKRGYGPRRISWLLTWRVSRASLRHANPPEKWFPESFLKPRTLPRLRKLGGEFRRPNPLWSTPTASARRTKFHHLESILHSIVFHHQRRLGNQEECIGIQYNWFVHHFYQLEYTKVQVKYVYRDQNPVPTPPHRFVQAKRLVWNSFVHIRIQFQHG